MMISITVRGFSSDCEIVAGDLGKFDHLGNKGGLYRNKAGTSLAKSYVFHEILFHEKISDAFTNLVESWGGLENISNVVSKYSIESVQVEIYRGDGDPSDQGDIYIEASMINGLAKLNAGLGIS